MTVSWARHSNPHKADPAFPLNSCNPLLHTHTHTHTSNNNHSKRVGKKKNDEWLSFFDVVLVGCGKPGFFNERRPLFAVNTRDGSLMNTDNGAPTLPIDEDDLPADQVQSDAG